MQLPQQAISILTKNMLPILSHGTVCDQGKLLCCYAKCQVAMAAKYSEKERKSGIHNSLLVYHLKMILVVNSDVVNKMCFFPFVAQHYWMKITWQF